MGSVCGRRLVPLDEPVRLFGSISFGIHSVRQKPEGEGALKDLAGAPGARRAGRS